MARRGLRSMPGGARRREAGLAAPSRHEAGFTLVELLVAMALLSMVGLALVGLQRFQLAAVGRLAVASVASLEADNRATDALVADAVASGSGAASNAGVALAWTQEVSAGPAPGTVAVTIRVRPAGGGAAAVRTLVRMA